MTISNFTARRYIYWHQWQQFWKAYQALRRRDDLVRLVAWAKRKRLSGPRMAYYRRLMNEELSTP